MLSIWLRSSPVSTCASFPTGFRSFRFELQGPCSAFTSWRARIRYTQALALGFRSWIRRVDEKAHDGSARNQLAQQFQPFCPECVYEESHARDIAAGTIETGNEAEIDRIGTDREYDRNGCGCGFRGERSRRGQRNDRGRGIGRQLGSHCRQSVEATIARAIFDRDIAPFDIAGVLEAVPDSGDLSIINLSADKQAD